MPDDLLARARRAAALAPAERDQLIGELADEVERLQRERDAYLNLCVAEDTGGLPGGRAPAAGGGGAGRGGG